MSKAYHSEMRYGNNSNDRKMSAAQILASHRKLSIPSQHRPPSTPPSSPHRKNDAPNKFQYPPSSENLRHRKTSECDDMFSPPIVRSSPMTLQEALGDVGCLGGEFERRLALQQVLSFRLFH